MERVMLENIDDGMDLGIDFGYIHTKRSDVKIMFYPMKSEFHLTATFRSRGLSKLFKKKINQALFVTDSIKDIMYQIKAFLETEELELPPNSNQYSMYLNLPDQEIAIKIKGSEYWILDEKDKTTRITKEQLLRLPIDLIMGMKLQF